MTTRVESNLHNIIGDHNSGAEQVRINYLGTLCGGYVSDLASGLREASALAGERINGITQATNSRVGALLRITPDNDTWAEALRMARGSLGHEYAMNSRVRGLVSDPVVERIIAEILGLGRTRGQTTSGFRSTMGGARAGGEKQNNRREWRDEDTRIRDPHTQRAQEPPQPKKPTAEEVVRPIISKVEDRASQNTLYASDPKDVQRVVSTVRRAREANPDLSDWDIYTRYMKLATGENPKPNAVIGAQILQLFAGGKFRKDTKLPF